MPRVSAGSSDGCAACCDGRFPERHVARGRGQQMQLDREEQDQQDAEPEGRHAERERAPAAERRGRARSRAQSALDDRHRHAEQEADERSRRRRVGGSPAGARAMRCSTGSRLWIEMPRSPAARAFSQVAYCTSDRPVEAEALGRRRRSAPASRSRRRSPRRDRPAPHRSWPRSATDAIRSTGRR